MKISIIVPVYNAEKYINKCIDSLLNQTYKNIEIIVVDDGSTDSSYEILKSYKDKISIIHQKNQGVSFSRNIALHKSTGDYIMFVDADDWIDNNMVEMLSNETKNGKVDIVRCGYIREYSNHSESYSICNEKIKIEEDKKFIYDKFIKTYDLASPCCQIIRRNCIKKQFDKTIKIGEDYLFNLDLYTNAKSFVILSECYYHYLYNDSSATTILNLNKIKKRCDDSIIVYNYLYKYMDIWGLSSNYKSLIGYRVLKELNMKLISLFKINDFSKKDVKQIVLDYFSNNDIQKSRKNLKFKTIIKNLNLYSIFILCLKMNFYNLYYLLASILYKNIYKLKNN